MFDNIIGQREVVSALSEQLERDALPRALLFFGPPYSGKLSVALETARALCCLEGGAAWTCPCPSCERHRLLVHPDLLLMGYRYFDVEIPACADAYSRTGSAGARYLFVRSVRKLLRRFDPALWDEETAEGRRWIAQAAAAEELLDALPGEGSEAQARKTAAEAAIEAASPLLGAFRTANIPVQQIRRLIQWAYLRPSGARKVAILESADEIHESSRNALLKLLEEPPEGLTVILTSTRRGGIIPTLLSRLRPYRFVQRRAAEEASVLERIFREDSGEYPSLREYFLAWREVKPASLRALAARFLALVEGRSDVALNFRELVESFQKDGGSGEQFLVFCEELLGHLRTQALPSLAADPSGATRTELAVVERWCRLVGEAAEYVRLYNPSPVLAFEGLYYRMRAAS